jgi:hypothetical protein
MSNGNLLFYTDCNFKLFEFLCKKKKNLIYQKYNGQTIFLFLLKNYKPSTFMEDTRYHISYLLDIGDEILFNEPYQNMLPILLLLEKYKLYDRDINIRLLERTKNVEGLLKPLLLDYYNKKQQEKIFEIFKKKNVKINKEIDIDFVINSEKIKYEIKYMNEKNGLKIEKDSLYKFIKIKNYDNNKDFEFLINFCDVNCVYEGLNLMEHLFQSNILNDENVKLLIKKGIKVYNKKFIKSSKNEKVYDQVMNLIKIHIIFIFLMNFLFSNSFILIFILFIYFNH